ncbi:MAG: sensor histidine kinase [Acidihalobacter sp.]
MALTYAVLSTVSVFLAGATASQLLKWQLFNHRDHDIHNVYTALENSYGHGGATNLVNTLHAYIQETLGHNWLFIAIGPGGQVLGGNVHALSLAITPGWSSVDGAQLGLTGGRRYRVYSGIVRNKVRLVVGMKFQQLGYLGRLVQTSFEWAFVVAVLLAVVGGSLIAHRMQRRFDAVRETMDRVSRGELAARVPLSGRNDDIEQVNRTFNALLRIAQIEAGARKTAFKPVDISALLTMMDEVYREVARDAGQSFSVALPATAKADIMGDRELLMQMLSNLIENSIRYCPAGSSIHCSATAHDDTVRVTVADNGPGIPENEHERVLRRFYRLEKSRTSGGTGLGLSLVKAVADLHDAELRLDSAHPGLMVSAIFARRRRPVAT